MLQHRGVPVHIRSLPILFSLLLFPQTRAQAGVVVLDFESLADLESVTNQFPGLAFTSTITLTAGISLNEFEFPPVSGSVVVSDDGGPIEITFASPVLSVSGYFTYLVPLTLTAFDVGDVQVGQVASTFGSNPALSGDPGSSPNELLSVASASGISRVTIAGDAFGGSFTLDNLVYETIADVPEPTSAVLFLTAFGSLVAFRRHTLRNQ